VNDLLRPVRLVPLAFLLAVAVGTLLLLLPVSRTDDSASALMPAAFDARHADRDAHDQPR
jgi:trk system potassium uptake protein TrkH